MATRRARIQIKPNTGPRAAARDTTTEKSPTTPTKQTPASPVKASAQTTPKPPLELSPVPQPVSKPTPPPPPEPSSPTNTKTTTTTATTTTTKPPSPAKALVTPPARSDIPKETEPEPKQNFQEKVTALEVFKKPDAPNKKSQPVKDLVPSAQDVATTSSQTPSVKKNSTRKNKSKDNEGTRQPHKNQSAFKLTEPPDRTKMTIMDLIHWNPTQNPMKKSNEPVKTSSSQSLVSSPTTDKSQDKKNEETENYVPGPRVIVGEDGQITIDESSLVIEQTAPVNDLSQDVVYETSDTTYSSYSKKIISRQFWTMKETAMFYKALSVVGTDFALMAKFFPKRTRADLKRKFKKEERIRRDLLDKAVSEWHNFDVEDIQDFLFCKEPQAMDDQDEEETRVDNPEGPNENAQPNNYVRDNLMNAQPKKRGRPQNQNRGKKKRMTDKENGTLGKKKEKKTNKRTAARNLWSDEEAEPVRSEDEIDLCDDDNEHDKLEDPHGETCDCCQLRTKTSERQKSLEAKKRRLQELEDQRRVYLESMMTPVREAVRTPTPEPLADSVSFNVLADKSALSPRPVVGNQSPIFRTPSTPTDTSLMSTPRSITTLTPTASTSVNGNTQNTPKPGVSFTVLANKSTLTPRPEVADASPIFRTPSTPSDASYTSTPKSSTKLTPVASTSMCSNENAQKTPNVGIMIANRTTSSVNSSTVTPPKPVNVVNVSSSVAAASPLLQALLNRMPSRTPEGTPNQFLLVADKTPNNEQVLHVYLVSPNPTQTSLTNSTLTAESSMQMNYSSLQRLGIRPITQQQPVQQQQLEKDQGTPENQS